MKKKKKKTHLLKWVHWKLLCMSSEPQRIPSVAGKSQDIVSFQMLLPQDKPAYHQQLG